MYKISIDQINQIVSLLGELPAKTSMGLIQMLSGLDKIEENKKDKKDG